jgi:hypothetical protein
MRIAKASVFATAQFDVVIKNYDLAIALEATHHRKDL